MKADDLTAKLNQDYADLQQEYQAIQETFTKRLTAIGQAQQALAELKADDMYSKLHADYSSVTKDFDHALDKANTAFANLTTARRALAEAKENLEFVIASALLVEMAEGGRINGKNAEIRALQTKTILAELQDHDGEVALAAHTARDLEAAANQYSVEYEQAKNLLSVLRNRARMIAGLANALAG